MRRLANSFWQTTRAPHRLLLVATILSSSAVAVAAQIPASPAATPSPIRDIAPPIDVFPYPLWMVVLALAAAAGAAGFGAWILARWWRNRPAAPPPSPRSVALRELERLRAELHKLDPYAFSIAVSDVLRTFVGAQYGLHAREQTSPEFLAEISSSSRFTDDDRMLLARFLERADMIKFARVEADVDDSSELLSSANAFVQGGRHELA